MPWTAAHDRLCLSRYLHAADQRYDPQACLLASRATATYHSQLRGAKVHETRGSGAYALALLESGSPAALQQAQEIWLRLAELQDVDPDSRTYGIWSYYCGSHLQLRCLHDGRDFASAQCFTAQSEGLALALVNFGSDGGDWHPGLDKIVDGRFESTDLRVRLELANVASGLVVGQSLEPGRPLTLQLDGSTLTVNLLGGKFGGTLARVEVCELDDGLGLDLVLQQATPAATVNWALVGSARAALAVAFDAPCDAQVSELNHLVTVRAQHDGVILEVTAAATLQPCGAQQGACRHRVARA